MILGRSVNHGRGLLLSVVLILAVSDGAQATPPLETETARLLKQGQLETDAAAEYQSSSEGSEVAIPLEFEYGITDWLSLLVEPVVLTSILPRHGSSTTGVGDLEITTFGHLVNEREYVPAIAIAGEVKVPTTQNKLIGTGEVDVTPFLIASKRFGRFDTHVNLGYGILGDPPGVKLDNIITYAAAVEFFLDEHWDLVAEVIGNTSSSPKVKGSAPQSPSPPPASPSPPPEGGDLRSLRRAAETPDQGSGGAPSAIPGEPSVIPEAAGAEVSGLIGVRYHFTPRFNVSLGVTYDNQNAVLVRPGLTFVFNLF